jgi:hypothetical protein
MNIIVKPEEELGQRSRTPVSISTSITVIDSGSYSFLTCPSPVSLSFLSHSVLFSFKLLFFWIMIVFTPTMCGASGACTEI